MSDAMTDEIEDRIPEGVRFDWDSRSLEIRFADLGPGDDLVARREIGMPVTAFLTSFGNDTITVLWWVARRKAGERALTYKQAEKEITSRRPDAKVQMEAIYAEVDTSPEA